MKIYKAKKKKKTVKYVKRMLNNSQQKLEITKVFIGTKRKINGRQL